MFLGFQHFALRDPSLSRWVHSIGFSSWVPDFCISVVRKRVAKTQSILDRLSDIEDSQTEYSILRSCLSLPKIVSALSPTMLHLVLGEFDHLIFNYLSRLVGGFPSSWSWSKATLPIDMGELGLRSARRHAPSVFLGSVLLSSALVLELCGYSFPSSYTADAFRILSEVVGHSDWSSFEDMDFTISQRTLSQFIDQYSFDSLSTSAPDNRAKALILATSAPHAGHWLHAIPSPTLGLHFHDVEFRFGLLYWLSILLTDSSLFCSVCDKESDSMGDHAVGCGGNGDRIFRHDAIRRREVPSIIPYSSSRPADIYLPFWSGGRPAAMDVTVISPL